MPRKPSITLHDTPYTIAKGARDVIAAQVAATAATLRTFPSGPRGLTPDHVKALPEWQAARQAYAEAFATLRRFNSAMLRTYPREIARDRAQEATARYNAAWNVTRPQAVEAAARETDAREARAKILRAAQDSGRLVIIRG